MRTVSLVAGLLFVSAVTWGATKGERARISFPGPFLVEVPTKGGAPQVRYKVLPEGDFPCTAGGAAGTKHNCKDIPVIILTVAGKCVAYLPYATLTIATGSPKQDQDLNWKIIGPPGYTFDNSADGIKLTTIDGTDPLTVWKDYKQNNDSFKWTLQRGAVAQQFNHEAHVWDPTHTQACVPGDPVIANNAN